MQTRLLSIRESVIVIIRWADQKVLACGANRVQVVLASTASRAKYGYIYQSLGQDSKRRTFMTDDMVFFDEAGPTSRLERRFAGEAEKRKCTTEELGMVALSNTLRNKLKVKRYNPASDTSSVCKPCNFHEAVRRELRQLVRILHRKLCSWTCVAQPNSRFKLIESPCLWFGLTFPSHALDAELHACGSAAIEHRVHLRHLLQ